MDMLLEGESSWNHPRLAFLMGVSMVPEPPPNSLGAAEEATAMVDYPSLEPLALFSDEVDGVLLLLEALLDIREPDEGG